MHEKDENVASESHA